MSIPEMEVNENDVQPLKETKQRGAERPGLLPEYSWLGIDLQLKKWLTWGTRKEIIWGNYLHPAGKAVKVLYTGNSTREKLSDRLYNLFFYQSTTNFSPQISHVKVVAWRWIKQKQRLLSSSQARTLENCSDKVDFHWKRLCYDSTVMSMYSFFLSQLILVWTCSVTHVMAFTQTA